MSETQSSLGQARRAQVSEGLARLTRGRVRVGWQPAADTPRLLPQAPAGSWAPLSGRRGLLRADLQGHLSPQAQLIAQSIGQAFSVAYQEFLRANGINPEDLSQKEYSDVISTQEMYNDDLVHFSKSENCKEVSARWAPPSELAASAGSGPVRPPAQAWGRKSGARLRGPGTSRCPHSGRGASCSTHIAPRGAARVNVRLRACVRVCAWVWAWACAWVCTWACTWACTWVCACMWAWACA